MYSNKSKADEIHRLVLKLRDKTDLRRPHKHISLSYLYHTYKNMKTTLS